MKLYLTRHGENLANIEEIMSYKIIDYSLTEKGREQGRYLAEWLADKQIAKIYSSPLKRALETTQIVAQRLGLAEFTVLEDLRELNVGVLDGRKDAESWQLHNHIVQRWFEGEAELTFEEGESHLGLRERLKRALEQIIAENLHLGDEQGVAVVCHGGILVYGLPWICDDLTIETARTGLGNTAVTVVEVKQERLNCLHWGLSEHLSNPL